MQLKDAPAPVQQTVKTETANATFVGLTKEKENGKTVYEIETKSNGLSRDLTVAADGSVISVEQEVALDSIPQPAQDTIRKKAAGAKIAKVEKVTEGSKTFYEAVIAGKLKKSEVKVLADGKITQ